MSTTAGEYVLQMAADGQVTVNLFGAEIDAQVWTEIAGYRDASAIVAALVERGLIARPTYSRNGRPARLTKAGQAALAAS